MYVPEVFCMYVPWGCNNRSEQNGARAEHHQNWYKKNRLRCQKPILSSSSPFHRHSDTTQNNTTQHNTQQVRQSFSQSFRRSAHVQGRCRSGRNAVAADTNTHAGAARRSGGDVSVVVPARVDRSDSGSEG